MTDASRRGNLLLTLPILAAMRDIEGWFSEAEADLLIAAAAEALRTVPGPHHLVEVGSYCGRSTVALGRVVQALGAAKDRVHAIDPHEGLVGAVGAGLYTGQPTLDRFTRTIRDAGLDDVVIPVVARVQDVTWQLPISLLFVDGLHDYASVCGDITHLERFLSPGGMLACHDYCEGYPGVRWAVDGLVDSGTYELVAQVDSLVVLRKRADCGVPPLHPLTEQASTVYGWFDRDALTLLGWAAARALAGDGSGEVVEVGGQAGQATSVLAGVLRAVGRPARVHTVSEFDGVLGGIGESVWHDGPVFDDFRRTLDRLGLDDAVVPVHGRATEVTWREKIRLLLVNDLHDYGSVAGDFRRFEPHLTPDATVVFHNYGDDWPGVRVFVNELAGSGRYEWRHLAGNLAVLRRVPRPRPRRTAPRPRCAVVTMVADEAFFLPIWLRYYSRFVAAEDLHVLDHDSTDGSTEGGGFVRIPVHNPVTDWAWHTQVVQEQQHRLLREYDMVLCTDVDEIVAPDPAYGDLGRYLSEFTGDFVTCRGWEVLHDPATEPPFDESRSALEQRRWWFPNPAYAKPLLARVPMQWRAGFHGCIDGAVRDDPRLFLLHLHRVDYERCLHRHRQRVARPWVPHQVAGGWGVQDRIVEPEAFARWFSTDSSWGGWPVEVQSIPERWRGVC